jgi:hypothetical protein
MSRLLALFGIALLAGCQTPGETVIGRANGRDLVVTEAEIQQRASDRGISRTVALRELRRESEMRAAIEMQKEWKSRENAYVEGVKARTHTDQPEAPNEDEVFEHVSKEQSKRADARAALFAEEDVEAEAEEVEPETSEDQQNAVADRLKLPSRIPEFESRGEKGGWNSLTGEEPPPPKRGFERLAKNKTKSQTPSSQPPTSKEKTPK